MKTVKEFEFNTQIYLSLKRVFVTNELSSDYDYINLISNLSEIIYKY